jgi:hypothetical protein
MHKREREITLMKELIDQSIGLNQVAPHEGLSILKYERIWLGTYILT